MIKAGATIQNLMIAEDCEPLTATTQQPAAVHLATNQSNYKTLQAIYGGQSQQAPVAARKMSCKVNLKNH